LSREAADRLVDQAREQLAGLALPCTLDTLGLADHAQPIYVGLMPPGDSAS
jgi:hypothetical protein